MKKLPEKIWLDADSCWNEKPQGEGYTEYIRKDIVEQGKKKMLDKVYKWLEFGDFFIENYLINDVDGNPDFQYEKFINDLIKAMED